MNAKPTEAIFKPMTITLLMPSVNKAISNYYKDYLKYTPREDSFSIQILDAERIKDNAYLIKLEASPYIGAHNTVGIDHLTFTITASGEVILEKYEHIKSYGILPHMSNIIIKWPPNEGFYEE